MKTDFVIKKSLTETLRRMKVGDTMRIKSRDFKLSAVKTAKNRLKKEGIDIKLSEAGKKNRILRKCLLHLKKKGDSKYWCYTPSS